MSDKGSPKNWRKLHFTPYILRVVPNQSPIISIISDYTMDFQKCINFSLGLFRFDFLVQLRV